MMIPTSLVAAALMVVAVGCKPPAPPEINIDTDSAEVEGGSNTTAAVETPSNTTTAAETPAAE
ncbi:hypothetical protein [Novipirellula caenicola]|uniref:hypothetical protein n=1 Tax=Novipirellula caenicola TaxID=1536901 RepID=UPI0031F0DC27